MPQLERLRLTHALKLARLHFGSNVSVLDLSITLARRLTSLEGLQQLAALDSLEVANCKAIRSLGPVAELPSLTRLNFSDCGEVESLTPLKGNTSLEEISFWGSTVIKDGNISVLRTLPNLRTVVFQNRRHYDLATRDFVF